MEDAKCLLDVINDPNALKDFLRSNSQISVEEEGAPRTDNRTLNSIGSGSSPVQAQRVTNSHGNGVLGSSNINHSSASVPRMSQQSFLSSTLAPQSLQNSNPTFKLVSNSLGFAAGTVTTAQASASKPALHPNQSLSNLIQRTLSNSANVVKTVGATIPSDAMQTSVSRPLTTAAMPSGSKNAVPVNSLLTSVPVTATKPVQGSTEATKKTVTLKNSVASTPNVKTVSANVGLLKSHPTTPVAIQAKKPIPIQPKNPALIPQPVNIQAQSNSMLKGLQYFTNTSPMKQPSATGQQLPFPSSTAQIVINGVNTAQQTSATTCLQPIRTQAVPQVLLSPSQKRIAPKQQPLLSQAVLSSSPQHTLQQTLQQSQQRVLAPGQSAAHALTQPVFVQQQSTPQSSLQQKHVVTQQNSSQPLQVQNSVVQVKPTNPCSPVQQSQTQQIVNLVQDQQGPVVQTGGAIVQPTANTQAAQFKRAQQLHQVQVTQQQNMQIEQKQLKVMMSSSTQGSVALPTPEGTIQSSSVLQNVQSKPNLLMQQQFIKQFLEQKKQQQQTSQLQKPNQDQQNQQQLLQQQQNLTQVLQQPQHQQQMQQQQQIKVSQKTVLQPLQGLNVLQQQKLVQQIQQQLQQKAVQPQVSGAHQVLQEQQKGVTQVSKAMSVQSTVQPNQVLVVTSQPAGGTSSKSVHLQQMMDQQQRQMQQILGQQQGAVSQQQKIIVTNQPVIKTAVPTSQATSTQQTPKQQQQNTAANTLQKVFIIKQPQVLQKLGMQGIKPQQTVQITPQQLQVLKQFQQQQQVLTSNNKLPLSSGQTTGQQTTTVITQQQLKKLQLHLQQQQQQQQPQGSMIKQALSQAQQRQKLDQQLQPRTTQQQGNTKVLPKQLPRILQTSGRQPVNQSGVVTVPVPRSSAVGKQEANKGLKRPHSEIADVPKAATKFKQVLGQDQQGVLHPVNKPFASYDEGIRKLARYHLYEDPGMSANDIEKSEALFSVVSNQLMRRSQKMMEKYRQLLYEESMRQEPSAEMVMLYRVFLADERAALANEKKLAKEGNLPLSASTTTSVTQCLTPSSANTSTVAKRVDLSITPCSVPGQTSTALAALSSTNSSEVATAALSISATSKLSTETKPCSTPSSSTNSSSAPEQQVDFHSPVQANHTTPSVDTEINSTNPKSSGNVSEEKDYETERTLEILDSILADLANQSS